MLHGQVTWTNSELKERTETLRSKRGQWDIVPPSLYHQQKRFHSGPML